MQFQDIICYHARKVLQAHLNWHGNIALLEIIPFVRFMNSYQSMKKVKVFFTFFQNIW